MAAINILGQTPLLAQPHLTHIIEPTPTASLNHPTTFISHHVSPISTSLSNTFPVIISPEPLPEPGWNDIPDIIDDPRPRLDLSQTTLSLLSALYSITFDWLLNIRYYFHRDSCPTRSTHLNQPIPPPNQHNFSHFWIDDDAEDPATWSDYEQEKRAIPDYVFEYAPLIYLHSQENWWPSDLIEHLQHTSPKKDYSPIPERHLNLTNLNKLNRYGRHTYLQSDDNPEDVPSWLASRWNIPLQSEENHSPGGRSTAPVPLIVVDKGNGVVDAFWFFFYSYNLGNSLFNIRFGNHVGDWEHTLVRFQNGIPQALFFSEHFFGEAYSYAAVEKIGKRPVGYSGTGTHAMYGTPGMHPYILPWGLLHDETDRGPLWDPALNTAAYTFDTTTHIARASNATPYVPTSWLYFNGRWGDKRYPLSDPRQYEIAGQWHYDDGPTGPLFKNLARRSVCQTDTKCEIKHWRSWNQGLSLWPWHDPCGTGS